MFVHEVIALYLRHCAAEGIHGPEAQADRRRTLGWFTDACGALAVAELKPYHLTDWVEAHPQWRSVSTRRSKANAVRAAFAWACRQERIDRNPFKAVQYAEADRRPDLPDTTLERVALLANKAWEQAVRFLRLTGARLSELCKTQWPHLDLDKALWVIPEHKSRRHTRKPKVVALVPEAVVLLKEIRLEREAAQLSASTVAGFVFLNNRGKPWTRRTLGQQLRRMKERYGIQEKATLHGIRHRFGTAAVAAGASLKLVAAQLGHSTVQVTERFYVDHNGLLDGMREAAQLGQPRK